MKLAGVLIAALVALYVLAWGALGDVTGSTCQGSPFEAVVVGYDFGEPDPDSLTGYDPRVAERQCEAQARRDVIKLVGFGVVGVFVGLGVWVAGYASTRAAPAAPATDLRTPDGRWWWDGRRWHYTAPPPPRSVGGQDGDDA